MRLFRDDRLFPADERSRRVLPPRGGCRRRWRGRCFSASCGRRVSLFHGIPASLAGAIWSAVAERSGDTAFLGHRMEKENLEGGRCHSVVWKVNPSIRPTIPPSNQSGVATRIRGFCHRSPKGAPLFWVPHEMRTVSNDKAHAHSMKPRLELAKRPRLGKTVGRSVLVTPNHEARVALYSSTLVLGIQRPVLVSLGPFTTRAGKAP